MPLPMAAKPLRATKTNLPRDVKSAKGSDSRGKLKGQFGVGSRRNRDPHADPTETEL